MSKTDTSARIRPDGRFVEVLADGSERPFPPAAGARPDAPEPDAPPMTDEEWRHARPVPRVRTLRRALALTQAEFAGRYHIPLQTLRDWEEGRTAPDEPARAYLTVIAHDPEGVRRALDRRAV